MLVTSTTDCCEIQTQIQISGTGTGWLSQLCDDASSKQQANQWGPAAGGEAFNKKKKEEYIYIYMSQAQGGPPLPLAVVVPPPVGLGVGCPLLPCGVGSGGGLPPVGSVVVGFLWSLPCTNSVHYLNSVITLGVHTHVPLGYCGPGPHHLKFMLF